MRQSETLPKKGVGTEAPQCDQEPPAQGVDFAELVRLHWGQIFRICLRITKNDHDAEDAAQECFLRAFAHLDQFRGKAQISTWLFSIARNCSLMFLRKRKSRPEMEFGSSSGFNGDLPWFDPVDSGPDQLNLLLQMERSGFLIKSIAALPISLRVVAELVILKEYPLQEASQILDISHASVKSRLFRARRRLSRSDKGYFRTGITDDNWVPSQFRGPAAGKQTRSLRT